MADDSEDLYDLDVSNASDVSNYLCTLSEDQIFTLGLALGLESRTMASFRSSPLILDEVILRWLQGQDHVTRRGGHTWASLVAALQEPRVQQYGIAAKIIFDKGLNIHLRNGAEFSSLRLPTNFQASPQQQPASLPAGALSYGSMVNRRPAQQVLDHDQQPANPHADPASSPYHVQSSPKNLDHLVCILISCLAAIVAVALVVIAILCYRPNLDPPAPVSTSPNSKRESRTLGCTPVSSANDAFDAVRHDLSDWMLLGYELDVPNTLLERIGSEQGKEVHRLKETLRTWYDLSPQTTCWEVLIQAVLRAGKQQLAKRIAEKHGIDWKRFQ